MMGEKADLQRKVLSITLAIIMVTGSVSIVFLQSSPIPQAFAANENLFISAENSDSV